MLMPTASVELDHFPSNLWDIPLPDEELSWVVLHARPQQEKSLSRDLREMGIFHYLPTALVHGRSPKGRPRVARIPIFTGYLFLLGDDTHRVEAMRTGRVIGFLHVVAQARLDGELRNLSRLLASGLPVRAEKAHAVGSTVRVLSGPLEGLTGVVERRGKKGRLHANIHMLGRGASVELMDSQVERVRGTVAPGGGAR